MAVKVDNSENEIAELLGVGGEVKIVPLLISLETYQILLEAGKQRGITPADLVARSIELFLSDKQDTTVSQERPVRKIDFVRPKGR